MSLRYLVIRTHGGLGNQLFQLLFGRLLSEYSALQLREVHDDRYPHGFSRCEKFVQSDSPSNWQTIISAARIPKILSRKLGLAEAPWRFGQTLYLDGYFQNKIHFIDFSSYDIDKHLDKFRDELSIQPAYLDNKLIHLRLGDFFLKQEVAINHVKSRLKNIDDYAHLITNDEKLLEHSEIGNILKQRGIQLVNTAEMSAADVLRIMSRYRYIDANDSTLTFWASVLAGSQVSFNSVTLAECRDFFCGMR